MSIQIPKAMRALVQKDEDRTAEIKEVPVPQPGTNEVLVRISYTAQNLGDYKMSAYISPPGVTHGVDFAGTVVALGENLEVPLQIGDRIAGVIHGSTYSDRGAHAQYSKVESQLTFKIPNEITDQQAATFGIGWATAAQVLLSHQGHAFPPAKVSGNPWYIIYGGSSSVGLFAISLAKVLGYRVLAVSSPHSEQLVRSYGADAVVDYHDPKKAIEEGLKITQGGAEFALDAISQGQSFEIALGLMGEKGKQLNVLDNPPDQVKQANSNIKIDYLLMSTLYGRKLEFSIPGMGTLSFPANEADREFGAELYRRTSELITKYGIKANPVKLQGGLEDILNGWEEMKAGKVSGTKLVYKIE